LDYTPTLSGTVDLSLQTINLVVSALTNIGSIYVVVVMSHWWWRLRRGQTNLRPLILGIALAKFGIWFWTASQMFFIIFFDETLPLWSLPSRAIIMVGVLMHVWVTTRVKPAPRIESISTPLER
jgi:hypothetical protein